MIDISKGRYWDLPWTLVDGCTPCSPGCDHCWSAGMAHRFYREGEPGHSAGILTDDQGRFNGDIITHPDRLSIPLKSRKPSVFSLWNDLFHEAVPTTFIDQALEVMAACPQHIFLVLTKRAHLMEDKIYGVTSDHGCRELGGGDYIPNVWWGLTVCYQQEADEKVTVFLQVPGKKFLSIEPMLSEISLRWLIPSRCWYTKKLATGSVDEYDGLREISGVILGGETGPRARPMHPDWVRSIRDQCAAAGVPFFFKGWGDWYPIEAHGRLTDFSPPLTKWLCKCGKLTDYAGCDDFHSGIDGTWIRKVGKRTAGRLLDGRTHDKLPWQDSKK